MSGKKFKEVIYWNFCEKAPNIKANKSMIEGTVFRQYIYGLKTIFI